MFKPTRPSNMSPGSPTSRHGACLKRTSPAHSNPFNRSESLRSYNRTPSTEISRNCRRNSTGANDVPMFLAVIQPSGPFVQCFVTSDMTASCASRSIPETCPAAAPPVSAESDRLQPDPNTDTSTTVIGQSMLFMIIGASRTPYADFFMLPMKPGPEMDPSP